MCDFVRIVATDCFSLCFQAMYWLPESFPASSVVVVSTLGSDSDTVKTLTSRNYVTIHIEDMSQNNKQEMCVVRILFSSHTETCFSLLTYLLLKYLPNFPPFILKC